MPEEAFLPRISEVIDHTITTEDFSASYRLRVLAALRRCKRLPQYGQQPLDQIDASIGAFDDLWGQGKVTRIPTGFHTVHDFSRWRSEARSGLMSFHGLKKGSATADCKEPADDWTTLREDLLRQDVPAVQMIGVDMILNAARGANLEPGHVSHEWLTQEYLGFATASKRRAFKLGWELIQKFRQQITVVLPKGLPFEALRKPRAQAARHPLPLTLQRDLQEASLLFSEGLAGGHRRKHRKQVKDGTVKFYLLGITYLYTASVELGHFSGNQDVGLADLADEALVERIIETELSGEFPWEKIEPSTLYAYLSSCKLAFRRRNLQVEWIGKLLGDFAAFENIKLMSSRRRAWCAEFIQSKVRQRTFFTLPQTFFNRAKPQIVVYRELNETRRKQALCWAVSAAAAAILTSIPLRISTLVALEIGGDVSTVNVRGKGKDVLLNVAGSIVKNQYAFSGVGLTPKPGGSPKEILKWFVDDVRPLLLDEGISKRLRRPDLLFCGINDARMRRIWVDAALGAGLDMTPHMVRHAIATVMANEPDADISLIAALLGDTEATVRKNYIFVEQSRKHQRGQEELARIQKNILGRAATREPRVLVGER